LPPRERALRLSTRIAIAQAREGVFGRSAPPAVNARLRVFFKFDDGAPAGTGAAKFIDRRTNLIRLALRETVNGHGGARDKKSGDNPSSRIHRHPFPARPDTGGAPNCASAAVYRRSHARSINGARRANALARI